MAKLVDIKGYWNMTSALDSVPEFNNTDMWEGQMLLEDDGWFEGIVNDPSSSYTGDRMVFGIYHPKKVIELIKISPEYISDPFVFRGERNRRGYEGIFSLLELEEKYCGVSRITTQIIDDLIECNSPQISGRNIESEKEALTHRIKAFKENNDFPELYENILTIRTGLSKHILEKYNGRKFRKEAIEDILAPVSDRVEAAIASNVKSLGSAIKPIDFGNEN